MPKFDLENKISASTAEPRVSVIIPAYNASANILETLESVFAQTYQNFEVIVINDGSPDTEEFERQITHFLDKLVYISQANTGVSIARNAGITKATGEIVAFLDSDDLWDPKYLESQVEFLISNDLGMAYCDADLFGIPAVIGTSFMDGSPSEGEVTVESLLDIKCNVITSGTIARKNVVEAAGMFENRREVQSEDFHLWVRIAHSGAKIGYQRKKLAKYRVSVDGLSGNAVNRVVRAIDVFKRLDRDLDLTAEQRAIIERGIAMFEGDLELEKGKALLLGGDFAGAYKSFGEASRRRRSLKLSLIAKLTRIVPRLVRKMYVNKNAAELALVQKLEGGEA